MKLFLISGKAEHGKDIVSKALKEEFESFGYKVLITHFADLLKYICKQFFNWNGLKDDEGRCLLQKVGTEKIRAQFPAFWADFIRSILLVFEDEWDIVLIPDCRFPNEIDVFEFFDKTTIRVERLNFETSLTEEQQKHASETALDDYEFDYYIKSESGEENIRKVVKGFLERRMECLMLPTMKIQKKIQKF